MVELNQKFSALKEEIYAWKKLETELEDLRELAQDVSAFHNLDAEAELTAMLSEQVAD